MAAAAGAGATAPVTTGIKSAGLIVYHVSTNTVLVGKESNSNFYNRVTIDGVGPKLINRKKHTAGSAATHFCYSAVVAGATTAAANMDKAIEEFYKIAKAVNDGRTTLTFRVQFKDIESAKTKSELTTEFRRAGTEYGFQTGGQKGSETLDQTALREASEEIGFDFRGYVPRLIPVGVHEKYMFYLLCVTDSEYNAINNCIRVATDNYYGEQFDRKWINVGGAPSETLNSRSLAAYNAFQSKISMCNIAGIAPLASEAAIDVGTPELIATIRAAAAVAAATSGTGGGGAGAGALGAASRALAVAASAVATAATTTGACGGGGGGAGIHGPSWRVSSVVAAAPTAAELAAAQARVNAAQTALTLASGIQRIRLRTELIDAQKALNALNPKTGGSRKKYRKRARKTRRQTRK